MTLPTRLSDWIAHAHSDRRAMLFLLIDPDHLSGESLRSFVRRADESGVDGFLVGGSLSMVADFPSAVRAIKETTRLPVIIFPGGVHHIDGAADAILFLSIISSRNPDLLIGQHVIAAPLIRHVGLEAVPTAYMIVESGRVTSTEYMSYSKPLPRHKPEIALAHAMAAELLGMKLLYLEAGSGADQPVPDEMIREVAAHVNLPLIVGGGIQTPALAAEKIRAGADIVIVGNHFEREETHSQVEAFAHAVHRARDQRIDIA